MPTPGTCPGPVQKYVAGFPGFAAADGIVCFIVTFVDAVLLTFTFDERGIFRKT